jgi:hypothetical protein
MNLDYLDFEQPIAELEGKIQALQDVRGWRANCAICQSEREAKIFFVSMALLSCKACIS